MSTENQTDVIAKPAQSTGFLQNAEGFFKMAETLSCASIIPKDFQNKPANVFVALEMAHRLGIGPMEAMQNIYVVHGTPSLSAKFLIGLANRSGRFRGGLRFTEEGEGKTSAVTCHALDRETGDQLAVTVTMEQADTAGWSKNAKYREIPHQMLTYRAATFFVRRFCPEVMLGMPTVEEAEEMPPREDVESEVVTKLQAQIDAHVEEGPPAPIYVDEVSIAKVVAAFENLGYNRDMIAAEFGDLDAIEPDMFARMRDVGRRIKEGEDWDEVIKGPATSTDLFDNTDSETTYDPADTAPI